MTPRTAIEKHLEANPLTRSDLRVSLKQGWNKPTNSKPQLAFKPWRPELDRISLDTSIRISLYKANLQVTPILPILVDTGFGLPTWNYSNIMNSEYLLRNALTGKGYVFRFCKIGFTHKLELLHMKPGYTLMYEIGPDRTSTKQGQVISTRFSLPAQATKDII